MEKKCNGIRDAIGPRNGVRASPGREKVSRGKLPEKHREKTLNSMGLIKHIIQSSITRGKECVRGKMCAHRLGSTSCWETATAAIVSCANNPFSQCCSSRKSGLRWLLRRKIRCIYICRSFMQSL